METTSRAPGARAGSRVLLLSLLAAWPLGASAYRPFDSTDAAVAAKGEVEIELGPLEYLREGAEQTLTAPSLILNWGFADRWEAVLEGRNVIALGSEVQERLRVEDIAFSLKGVLREGSLQEKHGVSVATELTLLLPTVNGHDHAGAEGAIIVSRRWPELTVHVNGAALWTRSHEPGGFGGVIVEGHDAWAVRPVAEVFVEGERNSPTTVSGLLGTIWRVSDRLSLDAAVRFARPGSVNTTELRVGLTWGFSVGFAR